MVLCRVKNSDYNLLMMYCQGHPNCRQGEDEIRRPGCDQGRQDTRAAQRDEDGVNDKIGEANANAETDSQRNSAGAATAQRERDADKSHNKAGKGH